MKATEILKDEHKVILLVLDAAEREAKFIGATGKMHAEKIEKMVDFFKNFADHCHHAKEEKELIPKMKEKGELADSKTIAFTLKEHVEGRQRIKAIADALPRAKEGNLTATQTIKNNLQSYIKLLKTHINKENNILFPMADKLFSEADQKALSAAFEKVEAEEIGEGVHEKYHMLAEEIAKE